MIHRSRLRVVALALLGAMSGCSADVATSPPKPSVSLPRARFPHDDHVSKQGFECRECHHETDAVKLVTPHDSYLTGNGIECKTCHHGTSTPRQPQACEHCHPAAPPNVADETLSAKVVIHETCWRCHPVGKGLDAQSACVTCHGTKRPPVAEERLPRYFRKVVAP